MRGFVDKCTEELVSNINEGVPEEAVYVKFNDTFNNLRFEFGVPIEQTTKLKEVMLARIRERQPAFLRETNEKLVGYKNDEKDIKCFMDGCRQIATLVYHDCQM